MNYEVGMGKEEIMKWKLETRNSKLETGNSKLETRNWKLEYCRHFPGGSVKMTTCHIRQIEIMKKAGMSSRISKIIQNSVDSVKNTLLEERSQDVV